MSKPERPLFTKSYPIVTCELCGKTIAARVAMAVASHARMHIRRGEAEERLDGSIYGNYAWYIKETK